MEAHWAAAIFVAYLVIDALYAYYTLAVIARQPLRAAFSSMVLYLLLGAGVLAFASSPWYLLPASLGGFLGTWIVVRRSSQQS